MGKDPRVSKCLTVLGAVLLAAVILERFHRQSDSAIALTFFFPLHYWFFRSLFGVIRWAHTRYHGAFGF